MRPRLIFGAMLFLSVLLLTRTEKIGAQTETSDTLARSTPEAEGVASEAIVRLIGELDKNIDTMNSLMILRHGKVIAECWWAPHTAETPHALYSLTKSFTSTAVGLAVAEGKFSLDDPVIGFFPDELPAEPSENLKKMTVRDLLTMSCGHENEATRPSEGTWTKAFLAHPVVFEPGTHFCYNTPGSYMLSAILQQTTGQTTADWLQTRLFDKLKIKKPFWETSPQGVSIGGQGLFLCTEDIAKFGQLYLQEGIWNGEQILPAEWVSEATRKQVSNGDDPDSDWKQGYGFQFWRCRHNIYRGDGAYCQFCVVIPEQDMVIASTADSAVYQEILNYYWDILLPAISDSPLDENPEQLAALKKAQTTLTAKPGCSASEVRNITISSEILGRDVACRVYLPKNYLTMGGSWPTLYLLHGFGDDETAWLNPERGRLQETADAIFPNHPEQKRIIVCPDGQKTWYFNDAAGQDRYEDFVVKEMIPKVEETFRCAPGRENRSVAGLSMGGYGALLWTLHHPELFSACYAISAAVWTDDDFQAMPYEQFKMFFGDRFGAIGENDDRVNENYRKNSILALIALLDDSDASPSHKVRFFLDCGDDDFLLDGNYALFQALKAKNIPVELRVRDGGHSWTYFSSALATMFEWLAQAPNQ